MLISGIFPSGFDALLKHVNGITRGYIRGQIVVDAPEILQLDTCDEGRKPGRC